MADTPPMSPVNPGDPIDIAEEGDITTTGTQVVEIVEEWSLQSEDTGLTGTRIFITKTSEDKRTATDLPKLGDPISDEHPKCILKRINQTKKNNDSRINIYTCSYDSVLVDMSQFTEEDQQISPSDLPMTLEVGGEMISFDGKKGWVWEDLGDPSTYTEFEGKEVDQPLLKRIVNVTMRIRRVIRDANKGDFYTKSLLYVGKINKSTWQNGNPGTWLYNGASFEPFYDSYGNKKWNVELNFSYRQATGETDYGNEDEHTDGWDIILREDDGIWARPISSDARYLYETADFDNLFNDAEEPVEE